MSLLSLPLASQLTHHLTWSVSMPPPLPTQSGVSTRRMKTQGWWCSTTAYITFDEVKVPVTNLIGEENKGFKDATESKI